MSDACSICGKSTLVSGDRIIRRATLVSGGYELLDWHCQKHEEGTPANPLFAVETAETKLEAARQAILDAAEAWYDKPKSHRVAEAQLWHALRAFRALRGEK